MRQFCSIENINIVRTYFLNITWKNCDVDYNINNKDFMCIDDFAIRVIRGKILGFRSPLSEVDIDDPCFGLSYWCFVKPSSGNKTWDEGFWFRNTGNSHSYRNAVLNS